MSYYNDNGTLMRDDGRFRCQACLDCKPLSELSPKDARYCVDCQPDIESEYSISSRNTYKPKPPANIPHPYKPMCTKMSTLNESPVTVDNFRPRGRPKHYKKRELPVELIRRLYGEGMESRAIASRLKAEQGIKISYKTIQRVLSEERN